MLENNLCGIDEAGRGPFAGPMTLAGVILHKNIKALTDSKKLSEKKREALFEQIVRNSTYHVVFCSAVDIDTYGLSQCITYALKEIMATLQSDCYLFDGNSSYGILNLEHKIKADASVAQVSAASIVAKVSRDRYMKKLDTIYPHYHFSKHKGYGTKVHIEALKKYGYCKEHRKSYKIKQLQGLDLTHT